MAAAPDRAGLVPVQPAPSRRARRARRDLRADLRLGAGGPVVAALVHRGSVGNAGPAAAQLADPLARPGHLGPRAAALQRRAAGQPPGRPAPAPVAVPPPQVHPPEQYRAWAGQAVGALQRWYNPRTGLWKTAGWWNSANALTAVIQHSQRTGEREYRYVIETTFGRAPRVNPGFSNLYYDDDGWWALAWIAAFDLTGEVKYLDLARALFAGMAAGWDDVCGGGVWWTRRKDYKNAIPNELFLLIAARLHQRSGGPASRYLDWALREWRWLQASGLIGPAGLVNDGLTAGCVNNGG